MTSALVALALLTPASAAEPAPGAVLTSTASCNDQGWTVHWKLTTTGADGLDAYLSQVAASITSYVIPPGGGHPGPPPPPVPPPLTTFVDSSRITGNDVLTEDQDFNPDIRVVELNLTVTWDGVAPATDLVATASKPAGCVIVNPTSTETPPDMPPPPDDDEDEDMDPPVPPTNSPLPLPEPTISEVAAGGVTG
jgi:hypothetical protein